MGRDMGEMEYPREFVYNTHSEGEFAFQFSLLRESQEAGKDLSGEQRS